jgi:small subunit ribosomal protein S11
MSYKKKAKKTKRIVHTAIVHVQSTFNNTIVSVTDPNNGDVLMSSSAGKLGYKGARKGTPFVASAIGTALAKDMMNLGIRQLECKIQGPGAGKDNVVRSLQASGFDVTKISEVTPLPNNGCRPPKKRRV